MFIRVAMTLDTECQFDIRDMMTGLMEPGHLITDADVTQLLTMPRGITLCLSVVYACMYVIGWFPLGPTCSAPLTPWMDLGEGPQYRIGRGSIGTKEWDREERGVR